MKVKNILISQPEPADLEKSPYRSLIQDRKLNLTFYKFFDVVGISVTEFRKTRIHLTDYTAIIFNSKNSIDHFFRMAKELREVIPETMKYFCTTETIALYLQNYIQYRKRKIFFGAQFFADLVDVMQKHRDEKYLFPCSDEKQTEYTKLLDKAKFKYTKAPMYRSVPKDLSSFDLKDFDMVCLFSPVGVRSLVQNFPDVAQSNIIVAAFGASTHTALAAAGIKLTIAAPTKSAPSMAMAIENYLQGKQQDAVIIVKPISLKTSSSKSSTSRSKTSSPVAPAAAPKKVKSVFTSKAKYKQLMEEKKARSAARRAERAAERARREAEAAAKAAAEAQVEAQATKEAEAATVTTPKATAKTTVKATTKPTAKAATKSTGTKTSAKTASKATTRKKDSE